MTAPLGKIQEYYHLPENLLIQVIQLNEKSATTHFSGDEFVDSESYYIEWAEKAFGDLGELDDVGYFALGEFIKDHIAEEGDEDGVTAFKITSPDGEPYSNIDPEVFDMLWDAIYLKRSLHVRGKEGNRYRVGVSPSHAAVTVEFGSTPSSLKVLAIAGRDGGKDEIYVKSAKAVRKFLVSKSFELGRLAANMESKPGTVDFIRSEPKTVKRGLFNRKSKPMS